MGRDKTADSIQLMSSFCLLVPGLLIDRRWEQVPRLDGTFVSHLFCLSDGSENPPNFIVGIKWSGGNLPRFIICLLFFLSFYLSSNSLKNYLGNGGLYKETYTHEPFVTEGESIVNFLFYFFLLCEMWTFLKENRNNSVLPKANLRKFLGPESQILQCLIWKRRLWFFFFC